MAPIYVTDCACDLIATGGGFPGLEIERCATDAAAVARFLAGSARFDESFEHERPPIWRYFLVHGPGGHVIGVR